MSHSFELQVGAYIVSDAHYSHLRGELLSFFKEIESRKLKPTQLILMGDIFDALFGSIEYTYEQNSEIMQTLESISNQIEVIFLEGNHDFNLERVFTNIKVFSLQKQPVISTFAEKKVALAHGDFDAPFGYQLYTFIIRNPLILKFLNYIDRKIEDRIIKKIDNYLTKKDDCKEFKGFEKYISRRELEKYKCDYFIEGHYHQNRRFNFGTYTYINLAAFACNQRYFIVKLLEDKELVLEENSHKEM